MPDPAQDPWGVALLGSGVLVGVGLLVALMTRVMGRSMTLGGWVMGLGLVAFLGSAVAGTHARIRGDVVAASDTAEDEGEVSAAGVGSTGDDDEADATAAVGSTGAVQEPATGSDDGGEQAPTGGDVEPTGGEVEPTPDAAAQLDLPADPKERRKAVRLLLRKAKKIATDDDCKDPEKLADIWAKVSAIPPDVERGRTEIIAKRLETCRRKLVWTTGYNVRRRRIGARGEFAKTLEQRLEKDDASPSVTVSGKTHERIRVGSQAITHEGFAQLLSEGLDKELEELGFESVIFSDNKQAKTTSLEPVPDSKFVDQELAPYGLDQRLALPEP